MLVLVLFGMFRRGSTTVTQAKRKVGEIMRALTSVCVVGEIR